MIFDFNKIGYSTNYVIREADEDPNKPKTDEETDDPADYTPAEGDLDNAPDPEPEAPDDGGDDAAAPQDINVNVDVNGGGNDAENTGDQGGNDDDPDADVDYTPSMGMDDGGDDTDTDTGETDDAAGEDGSENTEDVGDETGDDMGADDADRDTIFADLNEIEDQLFADLTDEQKKFKHKELKMNFVRLYDSADKSLNRINKIPKTDTNVQVLKLAARKLVELKDMIHINITETYYTRTYFENDILYRQCLAQFDAVSRLLAELIDEEAADEDSDDLEQRIQDAVDNTDAEADTRTI